MGPVRAGEGENRRHSFKKESQAFREPGCTVSQLLVARPVRTQRESRPDGGTFPLLGRTCLCHISLHPSVHPFKSPDAHLPRPPVCPVLAWAVLRTKMSSSCTPALPQAGGTAGHTESHSRATRAPRQAKLPRALCASTAGWTDRARVLQSSQPRTRRWCKVGPTWPVCTGLREGVKG